MRKVMVVLALTLVAVLGIMLAGCGSSGSGESTDLSDSEYVGTWNAVSVSLLGEEEAFDESCILTVNGDGTGTLQDQEGEISEFTWEPTDEGFKASGDVKIKFVKDGERIQGKIFGVKLNFEKQ